MWRGRTISFSRKTASSPNAASASRCAAASASANSAGVCHRTHSLAAAARRRLDHHGEADALGLALEDVRARSIRPRSPARSARRAASTARLAAVFDPIVRIASAGGPMKTMPAASQASAKLGVLREKAVAGMDRLRASSRASLAGSPQYSDSSRALRPGRCNTPRRPAAHAARRGQPRSRRRWRGCLAPGRRE